MSSFQNCNLKIQLLPPAAGSTCSAQRKVTVLSPAGSARSCPSQSSLPGVVNCFRTERVHLPPVKSPRDCTKYIVHAWLLPVGSVFFIWKDLDSKAAVNRETDCSVLIPELQLQLGNKKAGSLSVHLFIQPFQMATEVRVTTALGLQRHLVGTRFLQWQLSKNLLNYSLFEILRSEMIPKGWRASRITATGLQSCHPNPSCIAKEAKAIAK